jgi:response regulator of citrate/malate metabolism
MTELEVEDQSTHRKVIKTIHEHWRNGRPFAIHEIAKLTNVSNSSIIRCLKQLVAIRLVVHLKKGFAGRHYRVNSIWVNNVEDVINAYEYSKVLRIKGA